MPRALDALHRSLGRYLFRIAVDMPAQRDDALFDRHADIGRVDAGFEIELVQDELAQIFFHHN
jgi:hypothetical protein